ncbi:lactonase family protein [Marinicella meishanensis]|uniref:lactonase family protein n=1 Tax=Marinicella meishanensis TaxID=2873263 RepID=UPI001CBFF3E8|nr:beta-propeller fold lactonase family protein [Marinicella sp. NBU2979]
MKLHCGLLILFSHQLVASDWVSRGGDSYLEYVDFVSNDGVVQIEESPSGDFVYAGTSLSGNDAVDTITVYSKNPANGALTEAFAYTQGVAGVDGLTGINDIQITLDNSCLYVSSLKFIVPFDQDGHLAAFRVDSVSGSLSFVEAIDRLDPSNGNFTAPYKIALSSDNRFLYMAVSSEVMVFSVDVTDCQLTYVTKYAISGGGFGSDLVFDQSEDHLYVTLGTTGPPNSGGVVMFARDQMTGLLTPSEEYINGEDGIVDLENPVDLLLSGDGRYLYALAYDRDAVVVFTVDQLTSELTYDASYVNLTNGISGLIQPRRMAMSPDQDYLVIATQWDYNLVVFSRDQQDGSLVYESAYYDGQNGFDHMLGLSDILLSQDGFLYTTAVIDNAIQIINTHPEIDDVIFRDGFD